MFLILLGINFSYGWVYPEHRRIATVAIQNLDPEKRSILDQLWAQARIGYELRLSEQVIDTNLTVNPTFIDYASWTAISGDHSCSAEEMLNTVLNSKWILDVAHVTAELKIELAKAKTKDQILNALRNSDIQLLRVDDWYATRAGSNNVHFLLARPNVNTDRKEYLTLCLSAGSELNAIGAYTIYHVSALLKAARLAKGNLTSEERSALTLSALADEAFALHFLEDVFASGHVAGTWGNASQRKGTHDYYNEKGIEVTTWDGKHVVLIGDAYMKPKDTKLAAIAVGLSIEQLLDVASGSIPSDKLINYEPLLFAPDSFNVCKVNYMPELEVDSDFFNTLLTDVLVQTAVPGLSAGLGDLPRFRAELGTFIGIAPAIYGNTVTGGFGVNQTTSGAIGGIEAAIRLGIGLEGVLNQSGDGLFFLDIGWQQDGASSMSFGDSPGLTEAGAIDAAIPGRGAWTLRLRMPFWLLPLDLLILAPVLALTSPSALISVGTNAVNGGLIPWQSGIETSIGRFQFILGREIAIAFYGGGDQKDAILVPTDAGTVLMTYKTTQLEFPIVEYRPFRTFSLDQSSSLVIQLQFGVDIPHSETVLEPAGASVPDLETIWYVGLRAAFDWRHYF